MSRRIGRGTTVYLLQGDGFESGHDVPIGVQHIHMLTADIIPSDREQGFHKLRFHFHALWAGHHGTGHVLDFQLTVFVFEPAHHAIAAAAARKPIVIGREHDMRLALLIVCLHRFAMQGNQLPIGVAQGAVRFAC